MSPTAEQMVLPSGYGTPKEKLEWGSVNQMLVDAPQYWVASVRPDGCRLSADEEGVNTERPQAKPRTNGVDAHAASGVCSTRPHRRGLTARFRGKTCSSSVTGIRWRWSGWSVLRNAWPSCSMMRPTRASKPDGYLLGS